MESEKIALVRGYQKCNSKAMSTGKRNTGMWSQTGTRGKNYTIDRDIRVSA